MTTDTLKIPASFAPVLMGTSPFLTRSDLIKGLIMKANGVKRFSKNGQALTEGKLAEDFVLQVALHRHNLTASEREFACENEFFTGRADCLAKDERGLVWVVEAKYSTDFDFERVETGALQQGAVYVAMTGAHGLITAVLAKDTQAQVITRMYRADELKDIYRQIEAEAAKVIAYVLDGGGLPDFDFGTYITDIRDKQRAAIIHRLHEIIPIRQKLQTEEEQLKQAIKLWGVGIFTTQDGVAVEVVEKVRRSVDTNMVKLRLGEDTPMVETKYKEVRVVTR